MYPMSMSLGLMLSPSQAGNLVLSGFGYVEYPYMNFIKGLNSIQAVGGTDLSWITAVNSDQYPTTTLSSGFFGEVFVPPEYSGQWVLKWTGDGSVTIGQGAPGFTIVSGAGFVVGGTGFNLTVAGVNARVVFTSNAPPSAWLVIFNSAYAFVNMSNMVLCRVGDEAAISAGGIFTTDYISKIKQLNPSIYRNLNSQ